jgi:hypothetical protein
MVISAQWGSASLEYAVRSAFVGGLTTTMSVSAAVCVVGAGMVWRFLPGGRAVAAPDGGPVSAESAYADEPWTH